MLYWLFGIISIVLLLISNKGSIEFVSVNFAHEAFLTAITTLSLRTRISLSAIQSFLFVMIGNSIMEIRGMYFQYWIVLFSAWCFSNILGLVISDSFKTVITIYILIPFLIIPQLILSGIIVKFEKRCGGIAVNFDKYSDINLFSLITPLFEVGYAIVNFE